MLETGGLALLFRWISVFRDSLSARAWFGSRRDVDLNGRCFRVSTRGMSGVVDSGTRLHFVQKGRRVVGRYVGGPIARGYFAGAIVRRQLWFGYIQRERNGEIHGGRSECDLLTLSDGRFRIVEHFRWSSRNGSGTNVFDEEPVAH